MDNNNKLKTGFFFVISAAASAAATMSLRDASAQTCGADPAYLYKTTHNDFINVATATYQAELSVDSMYGFISDVAPAVYLGWMPVSASNTWWTYSLCRHSWSGSSIACGTTQQVNTTNTAHTEVQPAVTGSSGALYSIWNSAWDRYKLNLVSSVTANVPTATVIPIASPCCW